MLQRSFLWGMAKKELFTEQQLQNFGDRLKQVRKEKGYTNYEHFAYEHGFNRVQYGRYENGANISLKTLFKIVKAFEISLEEFFSKGFEKWDLPD